MCDWKPVYDLKDYKCRHEAYGKSKDGTKDLCIYHSDQEDKDIGVFFQGIKDIYKSRNHNFRGFIFPEKLDFKRLQGETEARNFNFLDADFSETVFLSDVHFPKAEFTGERLTSFEMAKFYGRNGTFFNGARFTGNHRISFKGTEFSGKGSVNFSMAEFDAQNGTDFTEVAFSGEGGTHFNGAIFSSKGGISFYKAQFSGEGVTSFTEAQFSAKDGTYFGEATFSSEAGTSFSLAQFSGKRGIGFYKTKFSGKGQTSFCEAKFSGEGETDFNEARFSGMAGTDFRRVQFCGEGRTYFGGVTFSGKGGTDFSGASFSSKGGTDFRRASFSDQLATKFIDVTFSGPGLTNFGSATFSGRSRIYFTEAKFSDRAKVSFSGRTFEDVLSVDFRNVNFNNADKVTFNSVDLNRCWFLSAEISGIQFSNAYWSGRKFGSSSYRGRLKVYDETRQEEGCLLRLLQRLACTTRLRLYKLRGKVLKEVGQKEKKGLRKALLEMLVLIKIKEPVRKERHHYYVYNLYNQLIKNYENNNRYHEAGDFFVGMMEMRRRGDFEKRTIRALLYPYKWMSLYGERPVRAFVWLLGSILLFGLLNFGVGMGPMETNSTLNTIKMEVLSIKTLFNSGFWKDYLQAIYTALQPITFGKVGAAYIVKDTLWGPLLRIGETLTSALFLSLFLLAMNRKFRRTKD